LRPESPGTRVGGSRSIWKIAADVMTGADCHVTTGGCTDTPEVGGHRVIVRSRRSNSGRAERISLAALAGIYIPILRRCGDAASASGVDAGAAAGSIPDPRPPNLNFIGG